MATPEEILNLNLSKIEDDGLKDAIQDWIDAYNTAKKNGEEEDFKEESQSNMDSLFSMVSEFFPDAIQKGAKKPTPTSKKSAPKEEAQKPKPKPKEKPKSSANGNGELQKVLLLIIGDFDGIGEELKQSDIDEADLILFVEMTDKLKEALEEEDEEKIKEAVEEALLSFEEWQRKMKESDVKNSEELTEKATSSINELLKELEMPLLKDEDRKGNESLKQFTKEVLKKFDEWAEKFEGRIKERVIDLTLDFRIVLKEKKADAFRKKLKNNPIKFYNDVVRRDSDFTYQKQADKLITQLENAIYEDELADKETPEGKKKSKDTKEPGEKEETKELEAVIFTEELVREVAEELFEFSNGLTDKDNERIIKTPIALEEALTEETDPKKLKEKVRKVALLFIKDLAKIADNIDKKPAIEAINPLLNALGESLLTEGGKQEKESDKERNERILEELEELQPEIDRCDRIKKEFNRKKKEAKGEKEKKPPSDIAKLKSKILSIPNLIPKRFKNSLSAIEKTHELLKPIFWDIIELWQLDERKEAIKGKEEIEQKFDEKEEKLEK